MGFDSGVAYIFLKVQRVWSRSTRRNHLDRGSIPHMALSHNLINNLNCRSLANKMHFLLFFIQK
jgi:hypothetical protein